MSKQTFPTWFDQPGCVMHNMRVTGADVSASTPATTGLDGRGKFLCNISKSSNVVTIAWNVAFADVPYVFFQPSNGQANTLIQITSSSTTQLVYTTLESDDNTTGVNDANVDVFVCGYNTTSFVS